MVFGDMLLLSILSFSNRMLFSNAQAKLAAAKSLKVTFATRKEKNIINWEVIFDPSLLALVNELSSTLIKIGFRASNHHQPDKNGVLKKAS